MTTLRRTGPRMTAYRRVVVALLAVESIAAIRAAQYMTVHKSTGR